MDEPATCVVTWVAPGREPIHIRRGRLMKNNTTVVGMDVHKEAVVVAVMGPEETQAQEVTTLINTPETIARFVKRLSNRKPLAFVYEAGPCGYEIQRQITGLG